MTTNRKLRLKPPPEGYIWAQDYQDHDGRILPGVATRLGISYPTYRKWRMRGKGPAAILIGNKLAARPEWVADYLRQQDQDALSAARESAESSAYDMRPPESRYSSAA